jgi:citronellol/citronellal dehydrogenase
VAALGAHVVITGRKPDKLAAVKAEIESSGGSCETHAFDIREEAQVKEAIAKVVAGNGRIHGLFNNAGGQFPSPAATLSAKGFDVVVRNNLTGGFIVSREVFTQSMAQHGGSIVNMAADMRNGFPNMAHTGAARAGMVNLTMTLAHEWAHAAVRVNAVSPGWIASSGMDTYQGEFKEQIPKLKGYCPLGRLGTESEVSAAVCFLMSDAAAYITGTEIRIDGGVPLGNRSMELAKADRLHPFNGFHLAKTPKVLGG